MRPTVLVAVAAATVLVALGACGSRAALPAATSSPPPPLTITEADFGQARTATVGQSIHVELTDRRPIPGSSLVWSVTSTDPATLEMVSSQHGAAAPTRDSSYTALFLAHRRGVVKIHAAGATTCEAMQKSACPDRAADVIVSIG